MNKERFTVTLRPELLKKLDGIIDGEKIRSRSHAVEYLLSQALSYKITNKVLILAGGRGFEYGSDGIPNLEQTLTRLATQGFTQILISISRSGESIVDRLGDGSSMGLKITYIKQPGERPGTAQPLIQAREYLGEEPFILIYGDVLTDINFADLLDFHHAQRGSACTMALTSADNVSMWGLARLVGSRITEYEEKPVTPKTKSHLVNAGIYVMEPGIFSFIKRDAVKLESEVFPRLAEESRLSGYPFEGQWMDITAVPQAHQGTIS